MSSAMLVPMCAVSTSHVEAACRTRLNGQRPHDRPNVSTNTECVSKKRDEKEMIRRGGVHVGDGQSSPAPACVMATLDDAQRARRTQVTSLSTHLQIKLSTPTPRPDSPTRPGASRSRSFSGSPRSCDSASPDNRNHAVGTNCAYASRRRNHPGDRGAMRRSRSGSLLSVLSSSAYGARERIEGSLDPKSVGSLLEVDLHATEASRVLTEAKAKLKAKALTLAEETMKANAQITKLESDLQENARLLELESRALETERDAHFATRQAMREAAGSSARREAALTFTADVAKAELKTAREDARRLKKQVRATTCASVATETAPPAETHDAAKETDEATQQGTSAKQVNVDTLQMELAGAHRTHDAAISTATSLRLLRLLLDKSEKALCSSQNELETEQAEQSQRVAKEAIEFVVLSALETVLYNTQNDSKRLQVALEEKETEVEALTMEARDRDALSRHVKSLLTKQKETEVKLRDAQDMAHRVLAKVPTREGEARGHTASREDALRARDDALEQLAGAERRCDTETERALALERRVTAAEDEAGAAVAKAKPFASRAIEAKARASEAETREAVAVDTLRAEVVEMGRLLELCRGEVLAAAAEKESDAKLSVEKEKAFEKRLTGLNFQKNSLEIALRTTRLELDGASVLSSTRLAEIETTKDALLVHKNETEKLRRRARKHFESARAMGASFENLVTVFSIVLANQVANLEARVTSKQQKLGDTHTDLVTMTERYKSVSSDLLEMTKKQRRSSESFVNPQLEQRMSPFVPRI